MPVKRVASLTHGDVIMWTESPSGVAEVVGHVGTAPELRWPGVPNVVVWDPGPSHVVMVVGNIRAAERDRKESRRNP